MSGNLSPNRAGAGQGDRAISIPNGAGAAAILAAGIGSLAFGILAFWGDTVDSVGNLLSFYVPSGDLSGATTVGVLVWLISWFALARQWSNRSVNLGPVIGATFTMLILGVLITFPPVSDLLRGL